MEDTYGHIPDDVGFDEDENSLSEVISEFQEHEEAGSTEGERGVKNLCRLVHAMGYRDPMHFGQFDHRVCYGDLINFLEDNSQIVEEIINLIRESDNDEWKGELESHLYARRITNGNDASMRPRPLP